MKINKVNLNKVYKFPYKNYLDFWVSKENEEIYNKVKTELHGLYILYDSKHMLPNYKFIVETIKTFLCNNPSLWILDEDVPFKLMKTWIVNVYTKDYTTYMKDLNQYKHLDSKMINDIFKELDTLYKENVCEFNNKQTTDNKDISINNVPFNENGVGVKNGNLVCDLVYRPFNDEQTKQKLYKEYVDKINNSENNREAKEELGKKFDKGKLRYDLIPTEPITALAEIYTMGAAKYGDNNWLNGMSYSRLIGAFYRHFFAWLNGEEKDPESGLSPLWHAFWNIAALITYEEKHIGNDDRLCTILKNKKDK